MTNGVVTVRLSGSNELDASNTDSYAGLNVKPLATLVVTNLEESARLAARSGEDAAAIGGNQKEGTGTIRIDGGEIFAMADETGAGIGSGYKDNGGSGDIYISGGRIQAFGGRASRYSGAGIGGGDSTTIGAGRKIVISGGTVWVASGGGTSYSSDYAADIGTGFKGTGVYTIEISGGNVCLTSSNSDKYFNQSGISSAFPVNSGRQKVYKVTLDGFTPREKVDIELSGYGTNDIYADVGGYVYLWLAPGDYTVKRDGRRYALTVNPDGTWTMELMRIGVSVGGNDVGEASGTGWNYDYDTATLSISGAQVVSGTNTLGEVHFSIPDGGIFSMRADRLVVSAASGRGVVSGNGTFGFLGGTAHLTGDVECPAFVFGGSLRIDGETASAVSNSTEAVHCVTVSNFAANAAVAVAGLSDYDMDGIYADELGRIYLWLPDGTHDFTMDSLPYRAVVDGDSADVRLYCETGVFAGDTEIGVAAEGDGWEYDYAARTLTLTGDCTLSGTNTAAAIEKVVVAGDVTMTPSRLSLGIGAGETLFDGDGTLTITNGTAWFAGNVAIPVIIQGGSVKLDGTAAVAVSNGTVQVSCVAVNGLTPGATVAFDGLPDDYGTDGIYADADGKTYLWLPNGTYFFTATDDDGLVRECKAVVADADTVAEDFERTGFTVNGSDIAYLSGDGWSYDGSVLSLSGSGRYELCGTNTTAAIEKVIVAGDVTMTPSRLSLSVGAGEPLFDGDGTLTITNGTAWFAGDVAVPVIIRGGSVMLEGTAAVAVSNGTAQVSCVEVDGLTPGAAVAFDGLPNYYGQDGIYADADGKAYLWLPEDWTETPTLRLLSAARRLLAAPSGTTHTFAANGYRYTVEISADGGTVSAEKGEALKLADLTIRDFAVEDGCLLIRVTASPATWLNGFADTLVVRASETLPVPETDDALLDLSGVEWRLADDEKDTAIFVVPLEVTGASMFFTVGTSETEKK